MQLTHRYHGVHRLVLDEAARQGVLESSRAVVGEFGDICGEVHRRGLDFGGEAARLLDSVPAPDDQAGPSFLEHDVEIVEGAGEEASARSLLYVVEGGIENEQRDDAFGLRCGVEYGVVMHAQISGEKSNCGRHWHLLLHFAQVLHRFKS
jgi:hypothetical protein